MFKLKEFKYYEKHNLVIPGIYDPIFKMIMVKHKDYFCYLINNILEISMDELEKGEFKNVEIPSKNNNYKLIRTDLTYKTKNSLIVIEANTDNNTRLKIRNKVHLGRSIDEEYSKKNNSDMAKVVYQLNFNRKNKLKNKSLIKMQLWDKELNIGEKSIYKIEINLDVINKKYYNNNKLTKFEKALLLLVIDDKEKIKEIMEEDEMLMKVGKSIVDYSLDEKKYAELREIELNETLSYNEGVEVGEKRGKVAGIKEGKVDVAKNLLAMGLSLGQISQGTGLSIDKIKSLSAQIR